MYWTLKPTKLIKNKQFNITDNIKSYEDACFILNINIKIRLNFENDYDYYSHQLKIIIKATNYIDNNNQEWIPDFDNKNINKYIPWLEKKSYGLTVGYVDVYCCSSYAPLGFFYKDSNSAKIITNRFIHLYNKWIIG